MLLNNEWNPDKEPEVPYWDQISWQQFLDMFHSSIRILKRATAVIAGHKAKCLARVRARMMAKGVFPMPARPKSISPCVGTVGTISGRTFSINAAFKSEISQGEEELRLGL